MSQPRVGVIGCGRWGGNLVRNFSDLGSLAAVCDRDPDTAETWARQHNVPALSLDQILATDSIDAVVIATPAELHSLQVHEALLAGKHTFVEKPLALTIMDAEGLKALAERQRRVLMVGHVLQYHPAFIKLLEILAGGEPGSLLHIQASRLSEDGAQREWNTLWGMASHDISMILAIAGELPEQVRSRYMEPDAGSGSDGLPVMSSTRLDFASGLRADITISGMSAYKEQKLTVSGHHAVAVFDDCLPWDRKLTVQDNPPSVANDPPSGRSVQVPQIEPLRQECRHFLDVIEHGGPCKTGPEESLSVLCVLEAAEVSLRLDRTINLMDVWETSDLARIGNGVKQNARQ